MFKHIHLKQRLSLCYHQRAVFVFGEQKQAKWRFLPRV